MLKSTLRSGWSRLILAILGSLIYALGINLFVTPLGLYTGGLMGICQLLRTLILSALHVSSLPFDLAGVVFYAINVPLLAIAWRFMGPIFFRNTVICATTYTLFVSLVPVPARPLVDDVLTSCLLGGVISGVGTGLVLTCGCSGGGLDALGLILSRRGSRLSIGQVNLACNATLFLLCGLLFDVPTMIYSILNTIFQAIAIDRAHQQSVNVQMLIFTKAESPDLDRFILDNLHRGITRWEGKGVYTGEDTHILCVCLNKYQVEDLQQELLKADPKAFFIIQEGVHISSNFERRLN